MNLTQEQKLSLAKMGVDPAVVRSPHQKLPSIGERLKKLYRYRDMGRDVEEQIEVLEALCQQQQ